MGVSLVGDFPLEFFDNERLSRDLRVFQSLCSSTFSKIQVYQLVLKSG